ncbi:hypothetical protein GCM10020370_58670 [Paenibacillus hodogayensis]
MGLRGSILFKDTKPQLAYMPHLTRLLPDRNAARHQWEVEQQSYERDTWNPPAIGLWIKRHPEPEFAKMTGEKCGEIFMKAARCTIFGRGRRMQ